MGPSIRASTLLLSALFALTTACAQWTATPTPLDANGRYVEATVALTCLGRRETAPQSLRAETQAIYQRYGYSEPMAFLVLTADFEHDAPIQARISKGLESCSHP